MTLPTTNLRLGKESNIHGRRPRIPRSSATIETVPVLILDQPFTIPRYLLARLAAEEYVRTFWWFIAIPPLFGIVAMFSGIQVLFAIGMFGVLWPLTIPARAALTGWKAGGFFSKPVSVRLEDAVLYFFGEAGKGMKLSLVRVRKIVERNGYVMLVYGIGEFVALPADLVPDVAALRDARDEAKESYLAQADGS